MDIHASDILVAGGGIGGLAAALALSRQGADVQLIEQAAAFSEVGAGIQIGPNVTRILQKWGLEGGLQQVASFPDELVARDARSGRELGSLPLGERAEHLYGAPYACIHRADLHQLLLEAVQARGVPLLLNQRLADVRQHGGQVAARSEQGHQWQPALLVGADGLWSRSRQALGLHEPPRFSGHLAYRGLVPLQTSPALARVTVWMGPRLHVVHYPVQAGRALNVVAIVHGELPPDPQTWDQAAHAAHLFQALGPICRPLQQTLDDVPNWRLWALNDRPPLTEARQMGQGAVVLLGDSAHPMRPYLAQGAGMAIEDAHVLAACWAAAGTVPERMQRYTEQRWSRNAQVQARAIRNGRIFHAHGPLSWGRNLAMGVLGARVMDVPWLYQGID
ncbi:MAG: FAD-dependent monooxygenase [Limnohabitans sp.]